MPTIVIIGLTQVILHSSELVFIVERKSFLNYFRVFNAICFILVPRLWLGDQNKVFTSTLYKLYWIIFLVFTVSVAFLILFEALSKILTGKYKWIIDEESKLETVAEKL